MTAGSDWRRFNANVIQVANAMAMTSNCSSCREGGVVVDSETGNVVAVLRSFCTYSSSQCRNSDAKKCPCHVSALGNALVQRDLNLWNTSITVASECYPTSDNDAELEKLLTVLGVRHISYNRVEGCRNVDDRSESNSVKPSARRKTEGTSSARSIGKSKRKSVKKLYGTATCVACGDQFDKTSSRQTHCNHWKIGICSVCGKVFQYKCTSKGKPRTCGSDKCVHEVRRNHMLDLVEQQRQQKREAEQERE